MYSFSMPVTVTLERGIVTIANIKVRHVQEELIKTQNSSRIVTNIFKGDSRRLTFREFFLPEVFSMFTTLADSDIKYLQTQAMAKKILRLLKENTWLNATDIPCRPRLDLNRLSNLTYTPLDFQMEFLKYYSETMPKFKLKGALLAAAPGSGKTAMSLMVSECLNASRIVIISPLVAVVKVWEDQTLKVFKNPQSYWLSTNSKPYENQRIAVYHYEALSKAIEDVHKLKTDNVVIILDECHNLNEIKALRTQLFLELCAQLNSKDILFV